jgi:hypothetical protein
MSVSVIGENKAEVIQYQQNQRQLNISCLAHSLYALVAYIASSIYN